MRYEIAGARLQVSDAQAEVAKAQAWAGQTHAEVLIADASMVFGRDHLESAVRHAIRARSTGSGVARDLGLETLRYLSGARQVSDAIRVAGLRAGTEAVAVVVFEGSVEGLLAHLGWARDDVVLAVSKKALQRLGLTPAALKTVSEDRRPDLALERTALLDIEK